MNLFFRELKSYRNGLIFWCLGMAVLVGSGMAKFATIQTTGQSVTDLISQFPQSIQTIFGLTGFDLTKASGYFGVLFMYIALMATVHAVLLGAGIISKEERDKTSEFLFVKPISRFRVITVKLSAGLINLIILNLATFGSSIYFIDYFSKGQSYIGDVAILMVGLLFLQLIFFFIGTMVAAVNEKPKSSASIATAILLFTFVLTFLININIKLDQLKYLTPFKYFDARDLMANGHLDSVYVTISLILIAFTIFLTYRSYDDRDLQI